MFQRNHRHVKDKRAIQQQMLSDKNFLEMDRLYQKSIQYQIEGNPEASTESYLKAMEIQTRLFPSWSQEADATVFDIIVPMDIWLSIFAFLSVEDLVRCMVVCKEWSSIAEDRYLWHRHFAKDYPKRMSQYHDNPYVSDWYSIYKFTRMTASFNFLLVIDIGGATTKYAAYKQFKLVDSGIVPSLAILVKGHHWSMNSGSRDFIVGREIEQQIRLANLSGTLEWLFYPQPILDNHPPAHFFYLTEEEDGNRVLQCETPVYDAEKASIEKIRKAMSTATKYLSIHDATYHELTQFGADPSNAMYIRSNIEFCRTIVGDQQTKSVDWDLVVAMVAHLSDGIHRWPRFYANILFAVPHYFGAVENITSIIVRFYVRYAKSDWELNLLPSSLLHCCHYILLASKPSQGLLSLQVRSQPL
eukprot:TRINITY_DN1320_c0_g1_i3.p1 TRINITY_DN1320_c0_g1~~TRINITY_DN1320_c0_g1_i3.p1  ORF type:complete len:415 (-),score=36.38 TRINITY_DN1320_c0_g1_i3:596-1840(-)